MKRILLSILTSVVCIFTAHSQSQLDGIRSSNYLGVKSVFLNPANIADNPYRWDVNIFSFDVGVGDYNASFNLHNLQGKMGNQIDSLMFGSKAKAASAYAGIDILGPGFMISLNKKTTLAFTTRARVMANIHDVDGKLVNAIQSSNTNGNAYTLTSANNQSIAVNGWADFGASLGRVIVEEGNHFLKGGITLKYLAGYSNTFLHMNNITGTINGDVNGSYLTAASGAVQIGEGGADLTNMKGSNTFQFKGSGAGADIGFVYEFLRSNAQHYKLKLSLALLDVGSIHYKDNPNYTAGYAVNISSTQKFYLNNINDSSVSAIKNSLDQSPYFHNLSNGNSSYSVSLPTTMAGSADLNVVNKFYVNLDTRLSFHNYSKYTDPYYQNNITLTPRYEGKYFGAYVPLNINNLTGFNAGVAFRIGPFFFGSGSVLTTMLGTTKQADFYFGFHFGGLRK